MKSYTCCKGVPGKNLRLFALWWHFGPQSLVWSVVVRFHFNFSAHPCRQTKISFDRIQPEQIKQDEVKSFEFYLLYV
jgi:hypothetical protein